LVEAGDLIAVECTGFAHSDTLSRESADYPETLGRVGGVMTFDRAIVAGAEQLLGRRPLRFAIDIAVARHHWHFASFSAEAPIGAFAPGTPSARHFGLAQAANELRGTVEQFFEHYIGTASRPRPFAGRNAELARLDAWLTASDKPPRLVVTGASASGKSALLARWAARITSYHVLFLPVSVRFGTSDPATIFEAFAANLAGLEGKSLPAPAGADKTAFYRDRTSSLLRKLEPVDGRPCVVVVDGVDESVGLRLDGSVLPEEMSSHIRIVISARLRSEDGSPNEVMGRLGLASSLFAEPLVVGSIGYAGVRALIDALGHPPRLPEERDALAGELFRLAKDDVLLLGFYAEEIDEAARRRGGRPPGAAEFRERTPGLAALFTRELVPHLTSPDGPREGDIDAALGTFAVALDPLPLDDFLSCQQSMGIDNRLAECALAALSRFILRTTQGLSFRHPRLADYVREERLGGSAALERANLAMLDWQRREAESLVKGKAGNPSRYLLTQHAKHLAAAAGIQPADWARITSLGWLRARLGIGGGGQVGVAADAHLVLANARTPAVQGDAVAIRATLRSALILASLRGQGARTSPGLVSLALRHGLVSLAEGEAAATAQEPNDRSQSFALLAAIEQEPATRERLIERSLDAAVETGRRKETWRSLDEVANALDPILAVSHVLAAARLFTAQGVRFVPDGLALLFARRAAPDELSELAALIGEKVSDSKRHEFYLTCARRLTGADRQIALDRALAAALALKDICAEVDVLLTTAPDEARTRALEWIANTEWYPPYQSIRISPLGRLLEKQVLYPSDAAAVLDRLMTEGLEPNSHLLVFLGFWKHRETIPAVDRLVRSVLTEALKSEEGSLARRYIANFRGLTAEERSAFVLAIATEPPELRAGLLARIAGRQPIERDRARAQLVADAKATVMSVEDAQLRTRYLLELAASSDPELRYWAAEQALQSAASGRPAFDVLGSSILSLARLVDSAFLEASLPKLLQIARQASDSVSQLRFRLALLADDPLARAKTAQEARDAAEASPDVQTALEIFEALILTLPDEKRRSSYDLAMRRMRTDEARSDTREMASPDKGFRRAAFISRVISPSEVDLSDLWEAVSIYGSLNLVLLEAGAAWKFASRLRERPKMHAKWFTRFEPAFRRQVQEWGQAVYTAVYWVVSAHLAPSFWLRMRFVFSGVRHLELNRNPWRAVDDQWSESDRAVRAQGILGLAAVAPVSISRVLRRRAQALASHASLSELDGGGDVTRGGYIRFVDEVFSVHSPPVSRPDGFSEAARRALLGVSRNESRTANLLTNVLNDAAGFPRKDALDLLALASSVIARTLGPAQALAALDDVITIWP